MRQKAYYTNSDTENNLYTTGNKYMLSDTTEYKGLYHKYKSTNEIYTEAKWSPLKSKPLIPFKETSAIVMLYKTLNPDIKTEYNGPTNHRVKISFEDRKNGVIDRYFLQKVNEPKIIEISKQIFEDFAALKVDPNLYKTAKLKWHITGQIEDSQNGSLVTFGVKTKNKQAIKEANKNLQRLDVKLRNLAEFFSDTTFNVPDDINNLDNT
tara:strand:- start:3449 stop:4075 length:627 start_codon:yes stop_codon:yes gene_type:complete